MYRAIVTSKLLLAAVVALAIVAQSCKTPRWSASQDACKALMLETGKRLGSWDAARYLTLSREGYVRGSRSCAFYPLWPATIRIGAWLGGGARLTTALLLANGLSIVACWLLYCIAASYCGENVGCDAVILALAFPGALFFSLPYTESLYAVLVLGVFWTLERGGRAWPCVAAFLMPLTRPVGVFIAAPLVSRLVEATQKRRKDWVLVLAPLAGSALYFGLMHLWTGNALEGFDAQKSYPYSPSISNMLNAPALVRAFANVSTLDGMTDSILDRGFFVLFLALLPSIYRLNKTWFWYTLPTGLVPALTSYFMSYRRYIMVCFPVFIVLAQLLAKTKSRWIFWYYVVLLALLQAWAVKQFVNFNWAG